MVFLVDFHLTPKSESCNDDKWLFDDIQSFLYPNIWRCKYHYNNEYFTTADARYLRGSWAICSEY